VRKFRVILSAVLLVLFLGAQTLQFAQETSTGTVNADQARRHIAIALLRTINTAEVGELHNYGSYSSWQTLLAHQPEYLHKFLVQIYGQASNLHFAEMPEILPEWNLRISVHADGQGYDILLEDLTDKKCGYAALTDENAVIRQSKAIDCEI
jgi:hypothetical protein